MDSDLLRASIVTDAASWKKYFSYIPVAPFIVNAHELPRVMESQNGLFDLK